MVTLLDTDDLAAETAVETPAESSPEISPSTCLACDGGGRLCAECGNIPDQCACLGGCSTLVDCGDCEGSGVKPVAATVATEEEYGALPTGEMDLRDDEPVEPATTDEAKVEPAKEVTALIGEHELLAEIREAEALVSTAEQRWQAAAEHAKDLKKIYETRVSDLRAAIRGAGPLFCQSSESKEPNHEGLNGTPKESPTNPEGLATNSEGLPATNGKPDAWRTTCIDALQAHGLSENIVGKLRGKSIETLGDLSDHQAKHGQWWFKEIKGLGEGKAAKVADAQAAFWAANPEYCGVLT